MDLSRLNRAIEYAATAHQGQFRKCTDVPYITHPYAVAMLLLESDCHDDVIIAGLLHDVTEDTKYTLDDIRGAFGNEVAQIVAGCSEHDKSWDWKVRKQHTIDYLQVASTEVKLVTCADKLHNVSSMLADHKEHGEALWLRFNEGRDEQQWYFQSLAEILGGSDIKDHPLTKSLTKAVRTLFP